MAIAAGTKINQYTIVARLGSANFLAAQGRFDEAIKETRRNAGDR
jgi:hypothetical protein